MRTLFIFLYNFLPYLFHSYKDATKQMNRDWSIRGRPTANDYRESDRATPKIRDSRTRERRSRSNSRSPGRKRSRSPQNSPPPRRRIRATPRYSVQIPKVSLDW